MVEEKDVQKEREEKIKQAYEEYIKSNKTISLRELSKKYGIPVATLSKHFKKLEGRKDEKKSLEEIVEKALSGFSPEERIKLRPEYMAKLEKFLGEPEDIRQAKVREALGYFIKIAERSKIDAVTRFYRWLGTPDGIIILAYIWKPEFREKAMRTIGELLLLVEHLAS